MRAAVTEMYGQKVQNFLKGQSCDLVQFSFHVPHASHFGGSWERHIQSARRILSSLLRAQGGQLTDETLRTLMYEVAAIMQTLDPVLHR